MYPLTRIDLNVITYTNTNTKTFSLLLNTVYKVMLNFANMSGELKQAARNQIYFMQISSIKLSVYVQQMLIPVKRINL